MNVVTATFSTIATQSTNLHDHNWVLIPENMASLKHIAEVQNCGALVANMEKFTV